MRSAMHPIACGIDVHKKKLACTVIIAKGKKTDFLDSIHIAEMFQMSEVKPFFHP